MNIRPSFTVLHDEDFPELEKEIYKEMQFINDHFGLLIRITAELERIFTFQTFFQTLVTLIMMASCLFVMSSVKVNSVMFYTQAEYCCCILTSATIFYWSGTGVITAVSINEPSKNGTDRHATRCNISLTKKDKEKRKLSRFLKILNDLLSFFIIYLYIP
nr:unnamed protein product [Callosobruchus analis]